ncbi:hypothetical protein [Massilia sp.]|uniref:hypothetical protein n=1 Tax=Massilia sp. TaxID=1882437 RepID=UPI00352F0EAC
MASVVLTYKGTEAGRESAVDRLRQQFPDAVLTPKTDTLIEAQIDDAQVTNLKAQGDWDVSRPTFAEIRQPSLNLKNIRNKLQRNG